MTVSPTPPAAAPVAFDTLEPSLVADSSLAAQGEWRVAWARTHMPVLARLRAEMERDRPLAGHRIGMCLHVEAKTSPVASGYAKAIASCSTSRSRSSCRIDIDNARGLDHCTRWSPQAPLSAPTTALPRR